MFTRKMTTAAILAVTLAIVGCSGIPSTGSGPEASGAPMLSQTGTTRFRYQGYEESVDCFFDSNRAEPECAAR